MPTEGIRVIVEADGERVLQQLLAAPPALAILDERCRVAAASSIAQAYRRSTQPVRRSCRSSSSRIARNRPRAKIGRAGEWLVRPFTESYARTRISARAAAHAVSLGEAAGTAGRREPARVARQSRHSRHTA
jgi:hypothetical protein